MNQVPTHSDYILSGFYIPLHRPRPTYDFKSFQNPGATVTRVLGLNATR